MKKINFLASMLIVLATCAALFSGCEKDKTEYYSKQNLNNNSNDTTIIKPVVNGLAVIHEFSKDSTSTSNQSVNDKITVEYLEDGKVVCPPVTQTLSTNAKLEKIENNRILLNMLNLSQPTRTVVTNNADLTVVDFIFSEGIKLTNTYERKTSRFATCQGRDTTLTVGFVSDEYLGYVVVNPNAGSEIIDGKEYIKVILALRVNDEYSPSRAFDARLSTNITVYVFKNNYDSEKPTLKDWSIVSGGIDCSSKIGTWNIRMTYSDNSTKDTTVRTAAGDYTFGATATTLADLYKETNSFGTATVNGQAANQTNTKTVGGFGYTYYSKVFTATYANGVSQNINTNYTNVKLTLGGITKDLVEYTPVVTGNSPQFGNATVTGNYNKYPVTFRYDAIFGGCSLAISSSTNTLVEKGIEEEFQKFELVNYTENCDGSATYTVRYVYNTRTSEVTVNSAAFNPTLTVTSASGQRIDRANTAIGNATITAGSVSNVNTLTEGKISTSIKAQAFTANYNGGFSQTLRGTYAVRTFSDLGKSLTLPGRTWTVSEASSLGTTSTSGNFKVTPVTFNYSGSFGSGCSANISSNANIYVEDEQDIDINKTKSHSGAFNFVDENKGVYEVFCAVYDYARTGTNGGIAIHINKSATAAASYSWDQLNDNRVVTYVNSGGRIAAVKCAGSNWLWVPCEVKEISGRYYFFSLLSNGSATTAIYSGAVNEWRTQGFFNGIYCNTTNGVVNGNNVTFTYNYIKTSGSSSSTVTSNVTIPANR